MSFWSLRRSLFCHNIEYLGCPSNLDITLGDNCPQTSAKAIDFNSSSFISFSLACFYVLLHITLSYSFVTPVGFKGRVKVTSFSSQKMYPMSSSPLYSLSTNRMSSFKVLLSWAACSGLSHLNSSFSSSSCHPQKISVLLCGANLLPHPDWPLLLACPISPVGLYCNTMDGNNILMIWGNALNPSHHLLRCSVYIALMYNHSNWNVMKLYMKNGTCYPCIDSNVYFSVLTM